MKSYPIILQEIFDFVKGFTKIRRTFLKLFIFFCNLRNIFTFFLQKLSENITIYHEGK